MKKAFVCLFSLTYCLAQAQIVTREQQASDFISKAIEQAATEAPVKKTLKNHVDSFFTETLTSTVDSCATQYPDLSRQLKVQKSNFVDSVNKYINSSEKNNPEFWKSEISPYLLIPGNMMRNMEANEAIPINTCNKNARELNEMQGSKLEALISNYANDLYKKIKKCLKK